MPDYTKKNVSELKDSAPEFGFDTHAARFATAEFDTEETGFSLITLKPGQRMPFGHRHDDCGRTGTRRAAAAHAPSTTGGPGRAPVWQAGDLGRYRRLHASGAGASVLRNQPLQARPARRLPHDRG